MKGIDELIQPVISIHQNTYKLTAYPTFHYHTSFKKPTLMETIGQYPPEILSRRGNVTITDKDGSQLMTYIRRQGVSAGSDGSVRYGIGGHSFCISDYSFTKAIWGSAQTVGTKKEIISLRVEHGGALGILLLLYAMSTYCQEDLPSPLTVYIDNSEVVRRGQGKVPRLGIRQ